MANYYFFYRFVKNSVLFFILVVHINNTSYITSFRAKGSARTLVRLRNQRLRNHVRHEKNRCWYALYLKVQRAMIKKVLQNEWERGR